MSRIVRRVRHTLPGSEPLSNVEESEREERAEEGEREGGDRVKE